MSPKEPRNSSESVDPFQILVVSRDASDEDIRAAYLARVRDCPPDRSPEHFERVRDAYNKLRDPRARIRHRLFAVDPAASFASVFVDMMAPRRFVRKTLWQAVLKGK
jgi:hypothetical protein